MRKTTASKVGRCMVLLIRDSLAALSCLPPTSCWLACGLAGAGDSMSLFSLGVGPGWAARKASTAALQ